MQEELATAPAATKLRLLIAGATGMVGGEALKAALADDRVGEVKTIGRSPTGIEHGKLEEVAHEDFAAFSPRDAAKLRGYDAALFCVGAYSGTVDDNTFRKITVDYALAFAAAFHEANPGAAFCFLSGAGADQSERSSMAFARYKGVAEKGLQKMGFSQLHIFRPGYIHASTKRVEPNFMYTISRALYPALKHVFPNSGIESADLAAMMIEAAIDGHEKTILENADIRALAQSIEAFRASGGAR